MLVVVQGGRLAVQGDSCRSPAHRRISRGASASSAFCSTSTTGTPASTIFSTMRPICCTMSGASPIEGSSRSRSFGRDISARPIASICCSPPESVRAHCRRRSFRRGKYAKTKSRSVPTPALSLRKKAPVRRFSSTVRPGKTRRPSGTCAMPRATIFSGASLSIRSPAKRISPPEGRARPEIVRSVVLFPAPFEPMMVTMPPGGTSMLTPFSAATFW